MDPTSPVDNLFRIWVIISTYAESAIIWNPHRASHSYVTLLLGLHKKKNHIPLLRTVLQFLPKPRMLTGPGFSTSNHDSNAKVLSYIQPHSFGDFWKVLRIWGRRGSLPWLLTSFHQLKCLFWRPTWQGIIVRNWLWGTSTSGTIWLPPHHGPA